VETWSIGEAARACGLEASTLRYYEHVGVIPPVPREAGGRRVFGVEDLAWIRYAACLRGLGMGVVEISRYVEAAHQPDGERRQMELLLGHLERMRAQRDTLDHFIEIAEAKLASKGVAT
jgi:DNA-binding transcriptional MerR regulator